MKISEIIERAALENDSKDSYRYIERNLKKGTRFLNRFGRIITYDDVVEVTEYGKKLIRIKLKRKKTSGYDAEFYSTFFKFNRNIQRKNLVIICNEYRSYEKKKIIFKK